MRRPADVAFVGALAVGAAILVVMGNRQWFAQDDWAYLLWRDDLRTRVGVDDWLMVPTNGHWVAIPALLYAGARRAFGLGSYWPFLAPTLLLALACVVMTRALAIRVGVERWTATLLTSVLLVYGTGHEFLLAATITSWLLSLVAFLAQLLLLDRPSPAPGDRQVGRTEVLAAAIGCVGVMSSSFGPVFAVGVAVQLLARRRIAASVVVVGPQLALFAWWWLTWGVDQAAEKVPGPRSIAPAFAVRGISAAAEGLIAIPVLTGLVLVAAALWGLVLVDAPRSLTLVAALWSVLGVLYLVLGVQRAGFGVEGAATGRYTAIGAFLLVPSVGLAIDQLRRFGPRGILVGYAICLVSITVNLGRLQIAANERSQLSDDDRTVFELVAGSDDVDSFDPSIGLSTYSPDVRVRDLAVLVEEGAITPRSAAAPDERELIASVVGG